MAKRYWCSILNNLQTGRALVGPFSGEKEARDFFSTVKPVWSDMTPWWNRNKILCQRGKSWEVWDKVVKTYPYRWRACGTIWYRGVPRVNPYEQVQS